MKSIGNIYLAWRKDANSPRFLVGVIKKNANDGVRFFYLADGAIEARKQGFEAYECFPDVTEVYTEDVLRFFGLRILKAAKEGYKDANAFFQAWDINPEYKNKPYYMLAYTQGILKTDNFEFLASFNPRKGFSLVTEVCDFHRQTLALDALCEGDMINYQSHTNKEEVKLYKNNIYIGQVKMVHSLIFKKAKHLVVRVHRMETSDKIDKVFIRITTE